MANLKQFQLLVWKSLLTRSEVSHSERDRVNCVQAFRWCWEYQFTHFHFLCPVFFVRLLVSELFVQFSLSVVVSELLSE